MRELLDHVRVAVTGSSPGTGALHGPDRGSVPSTVHEQLRPAEETPR